MNIALEKFNNKFKEFALKNEFTINNNDLYIQAFTHTTFANENKMISNERLEYLGDAILYFLTGEYIYKKYKKMPEGEMTKKRINFVCANANEYYAKQLGLDDLLLLGVGEEKEHGRNKKNVVADLFEAFIGALYLDHNSFNDCLKIFEKVVFPCIDSNQIFDYDFKSELQEFIQAENKKSVKYELIHEEGPAHDKTFTSAVFFDGVKFGEGVGKDKKESEQMAAKDALCKLKK